MQRVVGVPCHHEDSAATWNHHEVVGRVSCCHELGQGRVAEDGVVREADGGDVKIDQLHAEVVVGAEGHWEVDLPQRAGGTAPNAREGLAGLEPL